MLAAISGIVLMVLVIMRVVYLMCKKTPRNPPANGPRYNADANMAMGHDGYARHGGVDDPLRPEEILAVAHDGVAGPQARRGPLAVEGSGDATLDLDTTSVKM